MKAIPLGVAQDEADDAAAMQKRLQVAVPCCFDRRKQCSPHFVCRYEADSGVELVQDAEAEKAAHEENLKE